MKELVAVLMEIKDELTRMNDKLDYIQGSGGLSSMADRVQQTFLQRNK